ncbi:MAG: replication factor C small subunit [Candidatus Micrarchaeota archaeon]|nr:replication factor C small subunit [Candidatus Micrarchaeota archaeon]
MEEAKYAPWTEKYRPARVSEIVGQAEIVERLGAYVREKNMPNLLFAGPAGVGKTTAAIALARELYGEGYKESFLELNASDERGIDIVRGKIKDFARSVPIADVPFKIIFLDEADALTPEAQNALRRTMEMYAGVTRFILSCNYSSKIIEPIQSRCAMFRFTQLKSEDIEKMVLHISKAEGIHLPKEAVDALIEVGEGDMRKTINLLQSASLHSKKITEKQIYGLAAKAKPKEISEIIEKAYAGEFSEARKMLEKVMVNYGMSGQDALDQIYSEVVKMNIPDAVKVRLVDRIGEYNFRLSEGADERIQITALLAQISLEGRMKGGD